MGKQWGQYYYELFVQFVTGNLFQCGKKCYKHNNSCLSFSNGNNCVNACYRYFYVTIQNVCSFRQTGFLYKV